MAYELPKLDYKYSDMEPHIDAETMKLHYTKHHQGYIDKLNEGLKDYPKLMEYPVDILVRNIPKLEKSIQKLVMDQGGGHYNHCIWWKILSPASGKKPINELAKQINDDFDSFDNFKKKFVECCSKQFGSGWGWLIYKDGNLKIMSTLNHINPLTNGDYPILCWDLWEHARYLKYQNRADEYYAALWNVMNWSEINSRFLKAKKYSENSKKKNKVQKQYGLYLTKDKIFAIL